MMSRQRGVIMQILHQYQCVIKISTKSFVIVRIVEDQNRQLLQSFPQDPDACQIQERRKHYQDE
jgi:hypothetical protein